MPLVNSKVEISLKWIEYCVLTTADADAELYVLVVTLSTMQVIDNKIVEINTVNKEKHKKELLDSSYQGPKNG